MKKVIAVIFLFVAISALNLDVDKFSSPERFIVGGRDAEPEQ